MPIVSLIEWNQYLQSHPNVHLLQTGEWGELKSGVWVGACSHD